MSSKIPDELYHKIVARLTEPSDTKLAKEFNVSRKTIWRFRQVLKEIKETATNVQHFYAGSITPKPVSIVKTKQPSPQIREEVKVVPLLEPNESKTEVFSVKLGTYFAVQVLPREKDKEIVWELLLAAETEKIFFRKIQVLDRIAVGATSLVLFRSDVQRVQDIVKHLKNRAYIVQVDGSFTVHFPNGRTGKCPVAIMCSIPKTGFGQTFVGTKIVRWKHQFENNSTFLGS
jgi:hypothetical protein